MPRSTTKASEVAKANETAKAGQEAQAIKEKPSGNPGKEAVYSIEELTASSETALGVPRECAAAAFKTQKKERLSLSEAKEIVGEFMKSEVK